MRVSIGGSLLKPFQPRCQFSRTAEDMVGVGNILEDDGLEHEETL